MSKTGLYSGFKVEEVDIATIKPNAYNNNIESQVQFEQLKKSIAMYGFQQPIVITQDDTIVEGEHRYHAAMQLGLSHVPVVRLTLDEAQRRIATLAFNRARGSENKELTERIYKQIGQLSSPEEIRKKIVLDEKDDEIVRRLTNRPTLEGSMPVYESASLPKDKALQTTPLKVYGGKHRLASIILYQIPPHNKYLEAYAGGASILFAKEPANIEIINDNNRILSRAWAAFKNEKEALRKRIDVTLYDESNYRIARQIVLYEPEEAISDLDCAWAMWTISRMAILGLPSTNIISIPSGHGAEEGKSVGHNARWMRHKREHIIEKDDVFNRLKEVIILNRDAIPLISQHKDSENTFIYCDPPYISDDPRTSKLYGAYSQADYQALLNTLGSATKARWLLSGFDNPQLAEWVQKHKWQVIAIKQTSDSVSFNHKANEVNTQNRRQKHELLVSNYKFRDMPKNNEYTTFRSVDR